MATKFVNATAPGGGTGGIGDPYNALTDVDDASGNVAAGDVVYLTGLFSPAAPFIPEPGVIYWHWSGQDPWQIDASGTGGNGITITNRDAYLSQFEIYDAPAHNIQVTALAAGDTVELRNIYAHGATQDDINNLNQGGGSLSLIYVKSFNAGANGINNDTQSGGTCLVQRGIATAATADGIICQDQSGGTFEAQDCMASNQNQYGVRIKDATGGTQLVHRCFGAENLQNGFLVEGTTSGDVTFRNCLADSNTRHGFECDDSNDVIYHHNTAYGNDIGFYLHAAGSTNLVFINNLGSQNLNYPFYFDANVTAGGITTDYNHGDPSGAAIYGFWGGTGDCNTLADWQLAGGGANSIEGTPGFVHAVGHDFHLVGTSPDAGAGDNTLGIKDAITGFRDTAAPSIGCYEYVAQESILTPYSTIRGLNYLPTYDTVNGDPTQPASWRGIQFPSYHWAKYQALNGGISTSWEVERQLGYMRHSGFNLVRFWVPFSSWKADPAGFKVKFGHFLQTCKNAGIWAMPILFDSYTSDPATEDYQHAATLGVNDRWDDSDLAKYVKDLLEAEDSVGAVLLWDLYNEPYAQNEYFMTTVLHYTLAQIKAHNADYRTTIGGTGWIVHNESHESIIRDDNLDVIGIHPYGDGHMITTLLKDALQISGTDKPVIASEMGGPGGGSPYNEAIDWCRSIEDVKDDGVGLVLYQAMIGWSDILSGYIHHTGSGIFYHDGEIRDSAGPLRMRERALEDGVTATSLYTTGELAALVKLNTDYYYVAQEPFPEGTGGYQQVIDWLYYTDQSFVGGPLTASQREQLAMWLWYFTSFEVVGLAASPNDPFAGLSREAIHQNYTFSGITAPLYYHFNPTNPAGTRWGIHAATAQEEILEAWRNAIRPFLEEVSRTYYVDQGATNGVGTSTLPWGSIAELDRLTPFDTIKFKGSFQEQLDCYKRVIYEQWDPGSIWELDGNAGAINDPLLIDQVGATVRDCLVKDAGDDCVTINQPGTDYLFGHDEVLLERVLASGAANDDFFLTGQTEGFVTLRGCTSDTPGQDGFQFAGMTGGQLRLEDCLADTATANGFLIDAQAGGVIQLFDCNAISCVSGFNHNIGTSGVTRAYRCQSNTNGTGFVATSLGGGSVSLFSCTDTTSNRGFHASAQSGGNFYLQECTGDGAQVDHNFYFLDQTGGVIECNRCIGINAANGSGFITETQDGGESYFVKCIAHTNVSPGIVCATFFNGIHRTEHCDSYGNLSHGFYGIFLAGGDVTFTRNHGYGSLTAHGLHIDTKADVAMLTITNNLLNGNAADGLNITGVDTAFLTHNTCVFNTGSGIVQSDTCANNTINSNIAGQNAGLFGEIVYLAPSELATLDDYNHGDMTANFGWFGAAGWCANAAAWTAAGGGANSLDGPTDFVDGPGGDFHLLSTSPCHNSGDPAIDVGIDRDGDSRGAVNDRGCFEQDGWAARKQAQGFLGADVGSGANYL